MVRTVFLDQYERDMFRAIAHRFGVFYRLADREIEEGIYLAITIVGAIENNLPFTMESAIRGDTIPFSITVSRAEIVLLGNIQRRYDVDDRDIIRLAGQILTRCTVVLEAAE